MKTVEDAGRRRDGVKVSEKTWGKKGKGRGQYRIGKVVKTATRPRDETNGKYQRKRLRGMAMNTRGMSARFPT